MRVSLSGVGGQPAPPEMRRRVERRLRLVVGRRTGIVSHVDVQVVPGEESIPGQGARHRCRIRARLAGGRTVEVEEAGADIDAALEVAAWRLDRRLDRAAG